MSSPYGGAGQPRIEPMFDPQPPDAAPDTTPNAGPIIGIDPGVSRCGYGVVTRLSGGRFAAVAYGVITTSPSDPMPERLLSIATELDALVAEYKPSGMAVERVLFSNNARTAMSVGQANGLALVAAARYLVPVVEYSPNEVKLAVCGDGTADKAAVQAMVTRLLGLTEIPKPADAADALALALTYGWSGRLRAQTGESSGVATALEKAVQRAIDRDSALNTQKGSVIV